MILIEQHIIKKNHPDWNKIDQAAFMSKNIYNQAIYYLRRHYEETGKYLTFYQLDPLFRRDETLKENYNLLPNNTSQQILKQIDTEYKSYFALIRTWKKNPKILNGIPKPPGYKHKEKGRNILCFSNAQVKVKNGVINLPKKIGISPIKTKVEKLQFVRIIPQKSCYIIEIGYKKETKEIGGEIKNVIGIDLGIDNLCSIASNVPGLRPLLISGKTLKSINQYYNKKKAIEQSQLQKNHKKFTSNKTDRLDLKRNNKIKNYLHNTSKKVIRYCIDNNIDTIIIGHNKNWKKDVNIGKVNNQKFIQIPHSILISQIKYKAEIEGILVIETEESYTSKADHFVLEEMKHQEEYKGKRVKRGLFQSSIGLQLNADTNGAIGIMRKVIGDDFISLLDTGCVAQPLKINSL